MQSLSMIVDSQQSRHEVNPPLSRLVDAQMISFSVCVSGKEAASVFTISTF